MCLLQYKSHNNFLVLNITFSFIGHLTSQLTVIITLSLIFHNFISYHSILIIVYNLVSNSRVPQHSCFENFYF